MKWPPFDFSLCTLKISTRLEKKDPRHRGERIELLEAEPDAHNSPTGQLELGDQAMNWPQREHRQRGPDRRHEVGPGSGGQADRRDDPQACGGGEAAHVHTELDDRAGAQEADSGHDLRRDATRVNAASARDRVEAVDGEHGEYRGAKRHEHVGSHARLVAVDLALQADHRPEDGGHNEPRRDVHLKLQIGGHATSPRTGQARRRRAAPSRLCWPQCRSAPGPIL